MFLKLEINSVRLRCRELCFKDQGYFKNSRKIQFWRYEILEPVNRKNSVRTFSEKYVKILSDTRKYIFLSFKSFGSQMN